jgi:prepilin-type N-terminal cleavage/methylation domain-containing protein
MKRITVLNQPDAQHLIDNQRSIDAQRPTNSLALTHQAGFTLIEVLVVIIIALISLVATVSIFGQYSFVSVDTVGQKVVTAITSIRSNAVKGSPKNTFDLAQIQTLIKNSRGITVTTTLPKLANTANCALPGGCIAALCTATTVICYEPASVFSFAPHTAQKSTTNALFVANGRRVIAIVVEKSGQIQILNFNGKTWEVKK